MKKQFVKIISLSLALLTCMLLLASCSEHIKDKNGPDDYNVSFSDEELRASSTKVTATNGYDVKENGNVYSYADEKITGIMKICEFDPEGSLILNVDSEVTEGNLIIYVLHKNNSNAIVGEIPVGVGETFKIENPSSGKYILRIAAESANMDIKVTVVTE